jgi:POT family proton-dependent oligopeptide transporter
VIPRTWFLSLDPLFVLTIGPVLAYVWARQARVGRGLSSIRKMCIGALLVGCAFLVISLIAAQSDMEGRRTAWVWLVAFYLVFTTGELFMMPIGLSIFGRSLPRKYSATAVAAWFLAGVGGNLIAGLVGTLWSLHSHALFFFIVAIPALLAAAALWPLDTRVREMEAACVS